jgi:hypothetical protein
MLNLLESKNLLDKKPIDTAPTKLPTVYATGEETAAFLS